MRTMYGNNEKLLVPLLFIDENFISLMGYNSLLSSLYVGDEGLFLYHGFLVKSCYV